MKRLLGLRPLAFVVAAVGFASALALPFAPVTQRQSVVTWPAPGTQAVSSSALLTPYRPTELTVAVPCAVLRAAAERPEPVTVLGTGPAGQGLTVRTSAGAVEVVNDGSVAASGPVGAGDCATRITADAGGIAIDIGAKSVDLRTETPRVSEFTTGLSPAQLAGLTVSARVSVPFETTPSTLKRLLIGANVAAVLAALILLARAGPGRLKVRRAPALALRCRVALASVDCAVIAILATWAIVGPLAVDDGWAAMIARSVVSTGEAGNYFRWWNAPETPFALSQQLLAPFTTVSFEPLWLRLPSTLLAVLTWWVLSRFVLSAALGGMWRKPWLRALAAACFLCAWLPFNLGTRPESYVAFGVTTVLALAWRARSPIGLGWTVLAAAATIPISPTAVIVAGPLAVFAPRAIKTIRRFGVGQCLALLLCIATIAVTLIFADQTWSGLATATEWHRHFGPSLPWYREPDRYRYLLGSDQLGSAAKRMPVLLSLALLPAALLACARRRGRNRVDRAAVRLAATLLIALAALAFVPSKWSYHLGALSGLFAAVTAVTAVMLAARARKLDFRTSAAAAAAGILVSAAAALAFSGPNAWWLPYLYTVRWPSGPITPKGVPLDSVWFWLSVLLLSAVVFAAWPAASFRVRAGRALTYSPVAVLLAALSGVLALLLGSFTAAPLRQPAGSLAMANLHWLRGQQACGLADDIEVLADGAPFTETSPPGSVVGFTPAPDFSPESPPDTPGSGTSTELWGTSGDPKNPAEMTSPWFALPAMGSKDGVALTVSGLTGAPNSLTLQFGRAEPGAPDFGVALLGDVTPPDRTPAGDDPWRPSWRAIGVDAADAPEGADRVRIVAAASAGRLAFTGPRRRTAVPMTGFLAAHGPVLVDWPVAFLFPCVRNTAQVARGLASTPQTLLVAAGPWPTAPLDPGIGGNFAGLEPLRGRYELPTRLTNGAPADWGTLIVGGTAALADHYDVSTETVERSGASTK